MNIFIFEYSDCLPRVSLKKFLNYGTNNSKPNGLYLRIKNKITKQRAYIKAKEKNEPGM